MHRLLGNQFGGVHGREWQKFHFKVCMLIEELSAFEAVAKSIRLLENIYSNSLNTLEKVKLELADVNKSTDQSFGFFKKVPREEKLFLLTTEESKLRIETSLANELITLVYKILVEVEIPMLKTLKKQRFEKLLFDFSQSRIQELEKELALWQTINLIDDDNEDFDNQKIEKQDLRFTQLPHPPRN